MTLLHEALAPRSDQLNADDLIVGPRTIKITDARIITGERDEKKIAIRFEGDNGKPWKTCKTMGRAMVMVWGIVDDPDPDKISAQFVGKSVTIYRDPTVDFGSEKGIGGIRISHMSHIDSPKTINLTVSRSKRAKFVFQPLTADVTPMTKPKQTAEEWAAEHIGAVEIAGDLASLEKLIATGTAPVARLRAGHADLCERVMDAYNARGRELEAATAGSSDDAAADDFATGDA